VNVSESNGGQGGIFLHSRLRQAQSPRSILILLAPLGTLCLERFGYSSEPFASQNGVLNQSRATAQKKHPVGMLFCTGGQGGIFLHSRLRQAQSPRSILILLAPLGTLCLERFGYSSEPFASQNGVLNQSRATAQKKTSRWDVVLYWWAGRDILTFSTSTSSVSEVDSHTPRSTRHFVPRTLRVFVRTLCFAKWGSQPIPCHSTKKTSRWDVVLYWWAGRDSNPRRHCQQIYSLPRLTASVPTHMWKLQISRVRLWRKYQMINESA
jgi:hypothetical protein